MANKILSFDENSKKPRRSNDFTFDPTNSSVGLGVPSTTARFDLAGSTATLVPFRIRSGTAPTSPQEGMSWNDSTQQANIDFVAGIKQARTGTIITTTGDATVANTAVETSLIGTVVGTSTLPANFFVAGKSLRIRAEGYFSAAGTLGQTITIRIKLDATVVLATFAIPMDTPRTTKTWEVNCIITCRTTGARGTVIGRGWFSFATGGAGASALVSEMYNTANATAAVTLDTTVSHAIDLTAQWASAQVGDTITCTNFTVEVLN